MHKRARRTVLTVVSAAAVGVGMIVVAGGVGATGSGTPTWHHVSWTAAGPPLSILAPNCDAAHHCVYPFTETGTFHGDLEGTHVSAGGSGLDTTSTNFAVARTEIFNGTIKGCGSGSLVFYVTEQATSTHGVGAWRIVRGFGTGDLAHATGRGTGIGSNDANGPTSTSRGVIRCGGR